ncbi:hypothetical protein LTR10_011850 [Elasticomyces elasticus]|nr:hypothetical protein LTR10_011850 [Elasticomyces elasticus]KAK4968795.1 hypothetical protein LTR42_009072 [Elasticomyces elasticus]
MPAKKNTKPIKGTHADSAVHKALRKAAKKTPRYLFRAWSPTSGGNARLNTIDAIIPHAFLDTAGPASIDEVPLETLGNLWNGHFNTRTVPSIFSSWSHSLHFAVTRFGKPGGHLSVLDTKRLAPQNAVAFTHDRGLERLGLMGGPHEYLIFGVVSGECLRSVNIMHFPGYAVTTPLVYDVYGLPPSGVYLTEAEIAKNGGELSAVIQKANMIGGSFGLAVACHLLAKPWFRVMYKGVKTVPALPPGTVAKLASMPDVPEDWLHDIKGSAIGGARYYPDAMKAADLMKAIAELKYSTPAPAQAIELPEMPRTKTIEHEIKRPKTPDRTTSPKDVPKAPSKTSRLAKELRIDMLGWGGEPVTESKLEEYRDDIETVATRTFRTLAEVDRGTSGATAATKKAAVLSEYPKAIRELYIDMKGWRVDDMWRELRTRYPDEFELLKGFADVYEDACKLRSVGDYAVGRDVEDVEVMDCE